MDIYTVFYTRGLQIVGGVWTDTEYYDACEIRDSYKTLDDAVAHITAEINASAYTPPPNFVINVVNDNISDANLEIGVCWTIKDHIENMYIIVKRTLH